LTENGAETSIVSQGVELVDALPIAAAAFGVPQFLPQLLGVWRTGDVAGVSWSWAALTSASNGAWTGYFALSRMWTALVPSISATVLAGVLAVLLRRGGIGRRPAAIVTIWTGLLAVAWAVAGRAGLGTALTLSFVLQVTPSVWTAYRTHRPTGISRGTWLLILGELGCWGGYGLAESDPRLAVLGCTGVIASLLMLARTRVRYQLRATRLQTSSKANDPTPPTDEQSQHHAEVHDSRMGKPR
jgi:uncharacterized protein with PQ loop repeat